MDNRVIKDPNGTPLKMILLQVLEQDEQGPVLLRARRDHEKIDLANTPENQRTFIMVWAPLNSVLGELRVTDIFTDYFAMKEAQRQYQIAKTQLDEDIAHMRRDIEALQRQDEAKSAELRKLIRERDPDRLTRAVAEAVDEKTKQLDNDRRRLMEENAQLVRECNELRASKKKLKEANERLKEKMR